MNNSRTPSNAREITFKTLNTVQVSLVLKCQDKFVQDSIEMVLYDEMVLTVEQEKNLYLCAVEYLNAEVVLDEDAEEIYDDMVAELSNDKDFIDYKNSLLLDRDRKSLMGMFEGEGYEELVEHEVDFFIEEMSEGIVERTISKFTKEQVDLVSDRLSLSSLYCELEDDIESRVRYQICQLDCVADFN